MPALHVHFLRQFNVGIRGTVNTSVFDKFVIIQFEHLPQTTAGKYRPEMVFEFLTNPKSVMTLIKKHSVGVRLY